MAINVIMPQMGESIAEGTLTKWLKKAGDTIKRDEPLFEISTDKVDAEIPAPASGVLLEIKVAEGATVAINTVVAIIEGTSKAAAAPAAKVEIAKPAAPIAHPNGSMQSAHSGEIASPEERRRTRSSPLVRRIASEHGITLSEIAGSGLSGRVTKSDILAHVESQGSKPRSGPPPLSERPGHLEAREAEHPAPPPAEGDRVETMSNMRAKIAEHMIASRRISAHVTTVWEIDFSRVMHVRRRHAKSFEERGVKLTVTAFIAKACCEAIRAFPIVNSQLRGKEIVFKSAVNLGIAVALESGLIVPVVKHADDKSLLGLAKGINDVAERARNKKLLPEDVAGGTFTITNPGVFGSLFGTPIINQPQVAILGVGMVEKRPVVVTDVDGNDSISIRPRAYFALSFDHRIIDGATADQFMKKLKERIESFSEEV